MGILSSISHSFVLGTAEAKILEHGKPFGVKRVHGLETRSGGQFSVTVELHGDAPVRLIGRVALTDDSVTLTALSTGRRWLDMIADKFLVGKPLAFPPEDVRQLKKLWPD